MGLTLREVRDEDSPLMFEQWAEPVAARAIGAVGDRTSDVPNFWELHKRLHTHGILELVQVDRKGKVAMCCVFAKLSGRTRTVDPLLTILGSRQLVATYGNGFRPIEPFSAPSHLRLIATGCDRSAP